MRWDGHECFWRRFEWSHHSTLRSDFGRIIQDPPGVNRFQPSQPQQPSNGSTREHYGKTRCTVLAGLTLKCPYPTLFFLSSEVHLHHLYWFTSQKQFLSNLPLSYSLFVLRLIYGNEPSSDWPLSVALHSESQDYCTCIYKCVWVSVTSQKWWLQIGLFLQLLFCMFALWREWYIWKLTMLTDFLMKKKSLFYNMGPLKINQLC